MKLFILIILSFLISCSQQSIQIDKSKSFMSLYLEGRLLTEEINPSENPLLKVEAISDVLLKKKKKKPHGHVLKAWALKNKAFTDIAFANKTKLLSLAKFHLKQAIKKNPNFVDTHFENILFNIQLKKIKEAKKQLQMLKRNKKLIAGSRGKYIYYYLSMKFYNRDQEFRSVGPLHKWCRKFATNNAQKYNCTYEFAISLRASGEYSKAAAQFSKLTKLYPDLADTWYFLGNTYFLRKDFSNAERNLLKAQKIKASDKISSELQWCKMELTSSLYQRGQTEDAIDQFNSISENTTNADIPATIAARFLHVLKNENYVDNFATRALQIDKNNIKALYTLAELHFKQKDFSKAKSYFQRAIRSSDMMANYSSRKLKMEAYYQLASMEIEHGSTASLNKAINYHQKGLQLVSNLNPKNKFEAKEQKELEAKFKFGSAYATDKIAIEKKDKKMMKKAYSNYKLSYRYLPGDLKAICYKRMNFLQQMMQR